MFRVVVHFALPAVLLLAGAAAAQSRQAVESDAPAALYVKCTTVGSEGYGSHQCITFRAAAKQEIAACMSEGATSSHGFRALRLRCVDAQDQRFTTPAR
jgi:hypothetical protein